MKYLCLVYQDEKKLNALSQEEMDAVVASCSAWVAGLKGSGHHVFSAGLQSVRTATTLRSRGGQLAMTDGPFAETKEFLGGFTLLDARDLNEALQLASGLAALCLGTVEVRPVLEPNLDLTDQLDQKLAAAFRRSQHGLFSRVDLVSATSDPGPCRHEVQG
jgi:hypothetical protein